MCLCNHTQKKIGLSDFIFIFIFITELMLDCIQNASYPWRVAFTLFGFFFGQNDDPFDIKNYIWRQK